MEILKMVISEICLLGAGHLEVGTCAHDNATSKTTRAYRRSSDFRTVGVPQHYWFWDCLMNMLLPLGAEWSRWPRVPLRWTRSDFRVFCGQGGMVDAKMKNCDFRDLPSWRRSLAGRDVCA